MSVWIDGKLSDEASISVLDQTFLRGDGCFEALRSYGGRLFDLEGHLDRLERSAAALEMPAPPRAEVVNWLEQAGVETGDGILRLLLTRGPAPGEGKVVIVSEPLPVRPAAYTLATVEAPWHPAGRPWELAGVKSVSYAPNMAATRRAVQARAHDALLVADDIVLEGPTFSVGWVVHDVLETPTLELGILASVTRKHVLRLADTIGIPVLEGQWPISRLEQASEVMIWSTTKEVSPVSAVDETSFEVGPVTRTLAKEFAEAVSR